MTVANISADVASWLAHRRLLDHPFYRRWEAGAISLAELADYAAQYRHFEAYLPGFLRRLGDALPDGLSRNLVESNLADELGDPVPHLELFDRFANAVSAPTVAASPAMTALIATYDELLGEDASAGLAGLVAYESQAAEVARSKADGLRRHYGLEEPAIEFWDHHGRVDDMHGSWLVEALADLCPSDGQERVESAVRYASDSWWAFLDERDRAAA